MDSREMTNVFKTASCVSLFFACCLLFTSCTRTGTEKEGGVKPLVYVSILPQKYFVDRIGGKYFDVKVLVMPGQSPATYDPTPGQIAALDNAETLFLIGVPFEKHLLENISGRLKNLNIVDTSSGIDKIMLDTHTRENEHEEHGHKAGELDPHTWLDPALAKKQAVLIAANLKKIVPEHADEIDYNLSVVVADLDKLNREISAALEPVRGKKIYVFHPAFGYFARAYGLQQMAVETGGKEPGAKHIASLINKAKSEDVRVIFVQPQFSKKSAEAIAGAIGGAVVPIDPLAYDYIKNLRNIAVEIKSALARQP